ncbi:MAG: WD40/YVTN/BNR-like repeat-containing protein [Planctomycetota bacterium]|jgi:photosystem II stability/assembly factor-like uncharacterized protein
MRITALTVFGMIAAIGCVARPAPPPIQIHPQPTEHFLDEDAEKRNKKAREAWIENMHRAADGVDWRIIERDNRIAEWQRRNQIGENLLTAPLNGLWTEVGSQNLAGRMHCGFIGPDGVTLYGGSDRGGVWRGTLGGENWEPLGDNLYGTSNELVVLPGENEGESDVIVVTTNGGNVHVSRNDGITWEVPGGLGNLAWIRGVAVLDDAPRTVLLYAQGSLSGNRPAIYASTDYARTFSRRWQASASWQGYMWVPRVGVEALDTLYVVHQGQLLRSEDAGFSFSIQGTITGGSSRAVLTGSEAGAPRLYAAMQVNGQWEMHRSDDVGESWLFTDPLGDFWESLSASITNPNVVIYGGVEAHRSVNGGDTFTKINGWAEYYGNPEFRLHADIFGLHCWPDPDSPGSEIWYISTDGGIYASVDMGANVFNLSLSGLGISQYYATHTASDDPTMLLAGSQDQGYQRGFVEESTGPGPSTPMTQLISGDYGHLTSSDGTHNVVYSTYPGFMLVQDGALNPSLYLMDFPNTNHSWLPPVQAHPSDPDKCFFCGDRLYLYIRSGNNWNPVLYSSFDFAAGSSSYLSALAFAPPATERAYAVTDSGLLYYSTNLGIDWQSSGGNAPPQHYFYGSSIAINPSDPMEVAVSGSGYSSPGVVRSVNGGVTFNSESNGLPSTMVYDITYAGNTGDIYAATEAGAYRWNRMTGAWENIMSNQAPLTTYWSVESVENGKTIRFGTYGRGIWDFQPQIAFAPQPENELETSCEVDADCANTSTCISNRCYVPKNRFISIDPSTNNEGNAMARRVTLDTNGNGTFDADLDLVLGWMGEPAEIEISGSEPSPQWLSRIVNAPFFNDWHGVGLGGTVHLGDCHMSPGHTYLVQSILDGADLGDENNYSAALALPTVAVWGDVMGSGGPWSPPDGVANFVDIQGTVFGFQNLQLAPKAWLELEGTGDDLNQPELNVINFADILRAVQGFQGQGYPYADPCACAGMTPCP